MNYASESTAFEMGIFLINKLLRHHQVLSACKRSSTSISFFKQQALVINGAVCVRYELLSITAY